MSGRVARPVPARGRRGRAAGPGSEHEQRRRLERQRRAVDQARAVDAEGRLERDRDQRARRHFEGSLAAAASRWPVSTATSPCWPSRARADYRIPAFEAEGGLSETAQSSAKPAARAARPRWSSSRSQIVDLTARMDARRPPRLGRAGGQVDDPALRAHQHRGRERAGAGERPRAGVRQAEQGGHRGQLHRHDGEAERTTSDPPPGKALVATHIDSWENGSQNWTARMREEFQHPPRLRHAALPAGDDRPGRGQPGDLRAVPLGPAADDLRAGRRELRRPHARAGPCSTACGSRSRPTAAPATISLRRRSPTSRWASSGVGERRDGDLQGHGLGGAHLRQARSSAPNPSRPATRRRGASIPATIKALGDRAFCEGINRFVFHRYALQPWPEPSARA